MKRGSDAVADNEERTVGVSELRTHEARNTICKMAGTQGQDEGHAGAEEWSEA